MRSRRSAGERWCGARPARGSPRSAVVLHAGRARGDARHAAEAAVEVLDDGVGDGQLALSSRGPSGRCGRAASPSPRPTARRSDRSAGRSRSARTCRSARARRVCASNARAASRGPACGAAAGATRSRSRRPLHGPRHRRDRARGDRAAARRRQQLAATSRCVRHMARRSAHDAAEADARRAPSRRGSSRALADARSCRAHGAEHASVDPCSAARQRRARSPLARAQRHDPPAATARQSRASMGALLAGAARAHAPLRVASAPSPPGRGAAAATACSLRRLVASSRTLATTRAVGPRDLERRRLELARPRRRGETAAAAAASRVSSSTVRDASGTGWSLNAAR